ncbi:hypothetical protein ACUH89_06040 [Dermabacteraceae bacterium P13264]
MANDHVYAPVQNESHTENKDLISEYWQHELDEMPPEERERITASIRETINRIMATATGSIDPNPILDYQHQIAQTVTKNLLNRLLPINLQDVPAGSMKQIFRITHEYGIALYGAPKKEIVTALLAAPDQETCRRILNDRATDISHDCRALLNTCSSEWSSYMLPFAIEALTCFDSGYSAGAQALAASIIDTLLRDLHGEKRINYTPSPETSPTPRTVESLKKLPTCEALATLPIWHAYQPFRVENKDSIPETFNRHASAHSVSIEQYAYINAVQSILYSSTLLWFMDQEMKKVESCSQ